MVKIHASEIQCTLKLCTTLFAPLTVLGPGSKSACNLKFKSHLHALVQSPVSHSNALQDLASQAIRRCTGQLE